MLSDINLLAVLVAGVVSCALGALWYSPILFGKMWARLMGWSEEAQAAAKQKGMLKQYIVACVSSIVMAFVVAHFLKVLGYTGILEAIKLAAWAWLGFVAPVTLVSVLWEGKSWQLYAINNGYHLLSLAVVALMLVLI